LPWESLWPAFPPSPFPRASSTTPSLPEDPEAWLDDIKCLGSSDPRTLRARASEFPCLHPGSPGWEQCLTQESDGAISECVCWGGEGPVGENSRETGAFPEVLI